MIARRRVLLPAAVAGLAVTLLSASFGQQGTPVAKPPAPDKKPKNAAPPSKPDYDEFHLSTTIGSFKMLEFNDDKQPEGHLELNFTGTVLVDTNEAVKHPRGLTTTVRTEGNVRKEINYHGRVVYHGKGKIVVDGGWHALQWFGRDMTMNFNGCGVFRLTGEFDKNLETGYYWYKDGKKFDWGTGGMQPTVPASFYGAAKPTIKINGKSGG